MEKKHEERKAYMAPTVEFHAAVQDIIMCSGDEYGGGGHGGHGGWPWWPWG